MSLFSSFRRHPSTATTTTTTTHHFLRRIHHHVSITSESKSTTKTNGSNRAAAASGDMQPYWSILYFCLLQQQQQQRYYHHHHHHHSKHHAIMAPSQLKTSFHQHQMPFASFQQQKQYYSTTGTNNKSSSNKQNRKSPYDSSTQERSFSDKVYAIIQAISNRLAISEKINAFEVYVQKMPLPEKNFIIFFWLFVITSVCIINLIMNWEEFDSSYRVKKYRGKYIFWNGKDVDAQWQKDISHYGNRVWHLLFHCILGGGAPLEGEEVAGEESLLEGSGNDQNPKSNNKSTTQANRDLLGEVFSGMPQKLMHVDVLLHFLSHFQVADSQVLHTENASETVHYTKEQNDRYEQFLRRMFLNLNHSYPFFPAMVCVRHKEEVEKMVQLLSKRLSRELMPGESIVVPLYTRAKHSEDVQGPHRSYITLTVTPDSSRDARYVDVSFYDTRTIHWALNPKGKNHNDTKGHVRVDYKHLLVDPQFTENFIDFFVSVARLPNGAYRTSPKQASIHNFEHYRVFMKQLFGPECEHIPEEKRKLQVYGTCSWEALEKIIRDWSNDDAVLTHRFKTDFRHWIYHEAQRLERRGKLDSPSKHRVQFVPLLKSEIEKQLVHDEKKLYGLLQARGEATEEKTVVV